MKNGFWTATLLGVASIGLASCGEAPPAQEAAPDAPEGVSVDNARLLLPAVAGNPAAVYFDLKNDSEKNLMLRAASVQGGASAVFHQMGTWNLQPSMDELFQVPVPPGETVKFEPDGKHVMVNDLADTVTAGGETEVTLTFVGGDKVSFPAEVRAAGDDR